VGWKPVDGAPHFRTKKEANAFFELVAKFLNLRIWYDEFETNAVIDWKAFRKGAADEH